MTQELSKIMDVANQAVFLKMNQVIIYLIPEVFDLSWNQKEEGRNPETLYVSAIVTM